MKTMNLFLRSAFFGAAVLFSGFAQAENLSETYAKAVRNDPAIREAEANMMAQLEKKPQARATLLPQIDASGSFTNTVDDGTRLQEFGGIPTNVDQERDQDTTSWSVELRQTLFDTERWRQLSRAEEEVAKARADYEVARQDLMVRVAEAYFEVLAAQDTLAAERAAKEAIGRQLEQAERRFEVGLIAITDVKESQAAFDDATALEIAARRSLATAKEALREITGEYPETLATPGAEFPLIPPNPQVEQDWVDMALQQNSELESARLQAEVSRENIAIAKSGHLPTLEFTASYGESKDKGDVENRTVGNDFEIDNDGARTRLGLQLSFPIFSGGGTSSRVEEQVQLHRASLESYEKTARNTERETRDAYLGVIAEIARVRALARSVESNQTALEATEAGYDVGTRTTVDVLSARESLFRAETQYARSKYDYLINVLKLKQAAGTLTSADVAEINTWLENNESLDVTPGRGDVPDAQMPEGSVPSNPDAASSS